MSDVFDYAKYFIKQGLDTSRDTFDGNMKLQKLLVFASLISLAERDVPLFADEILAFQQGCVVEKVRIRYKNDCAGFVEDSYKFNPVFSQEEYDIITLTVALFGRLSARDLSDINHTFEFWNKAYNNSIQADGFRDKGMSVVTIDAMRDELGKVRNMITAFRNNEKENHSRETINGVDFYFSPINLALTDDFIDHLYNFSLSADGKAYSVYLDDGGLVIY